MNFSNLHRFIGFSLLLVLAFAIGPSISSVHADDVISNGCDLCGSAGYTDYSAGSAGYTDYASTGNAGYTDYTTSNAGYTDYSVNNTGYTDYTTSNAGYTDYAAVNPGYTDYTTIHPGYTDYTSVNAGYTDYTSVRPGYTDYAAVGAGYTDYSLSRYSAGTNYTSPVYYTSGGGNGYRSSGYGYGSGYNYGGGYSYPSYSSGSNYSYPIFNTVPIAHPVQIATNAIAATPVQTQTVVQAQPQPVVQYVAPQPQPINPIVYPTPAPTPAPVYNNPVSCYISSNVSTISYGQQAQLAWYAYGANTAYLSDGIGSVAVNGTITVNPSSTHTYTLTVYGYNGQTSSCNVTIGVNGYYAAPTAPVVQATPAPYVSLSQIPYTGFDYGTFGNMLYWLSLMGFAAAAGYLMLYYKGGLGFAFAGRRSHKGAVTAVTRSVPRVTEVKREPASARIASAVENLPTREYRNATTDTMSITRAASANEMPRIVISRA